MAKKNTPKPKPSSKVQKSTGNNLPLWIVLGITFFAFINAINNGFVNWDDPVNLTQNANLEEISFANLLNIFNPETGTLLGNYNPLPIFTFFIEKALFGLNPAVFHFNNILLHLICVFFVYKILEKLGMPFWGILFASLLFGIHPMRVESVAWITERKDVLFASFYFAAIYTYILHLKEPENSAKWKWWTLGLFVLSLFSKIQAVSLPLSLLAIDYWLNRPLKLKLLIEKTPHFALSLVFGLAGIYFLGKEHSLDTVTNYSFLERILIGAYSYCVYIIKWIFPYEMAPIYPYNVELPKAAYFAPIGVAAVLGLAVWAYLKKEKVLVFGIAFFTFNIMFLLQVLGAGQGLLADRFSYVAYFGLFFIAAWYLVKLLEKYPQQKTIFLGLGGAYVLLFFVMTHQQNKVWENGETLWTHSMNVTPNAYTPYQNLGKYYQSIGQPEKSKDLFKTSIRLAKKKDIPHNSRGKIFFDANQLDSALYHFNAAIESGTNISEIYVNRGATLARLGKLEAALPDFNKAIEIEPDNKQAYLMRSLLHFSREDYEKASFDHMQVLKYEPYNADVWYEEGVTQKMMNKPNEALQYLNKAVELNSQNPIYYMERSKVHLMLGQNEQAEADRQKAQQLQ